MGFLVPLIIILSYLAIAMVTARTRLAKLYKNQEHTTKITKDDYLWAWTSSTAWPLLVIIVTIEFLTTPSIVKKRRREKELRKQREKLQEQHEKLKKQAKNLGIWTGPE